MRLAEILKGCGLAYGAGSNKCEIPDDQGRWCRGTHEEEEWWGWQRYPRVAGWRAMLGATSVRFQMSREDDVEELMKRKNDGDGRDIQGLRAGVWCWEQQMWDSGWSREDDVEELMKRKNDGVGRYIQGLRAGVRCWEQQLWDSGWSGKMM